MHMEIDAPLYLLLIPVAAIYLVVTAFMLIKKGRKRIKSTLVMHALVAFLLVLALCQIKLRRISNEVNTVFVVDVSDSMKDYRKKTADFIKNAIEEMPDNNYAGIVAFGAEARLEQFMSDRKLFDGFHSSPLSTATNMELALSTAITMLDQDRSGRIVMLTDGEVNEGDVTAMASSLTAANVEMKFVKVEKTDNPEVYVDTLDIPEKISVGDTFSIEVHVVSNVSTDATLYLYNGRTQKSAQNVHLEVGENRFVFNDTHGDTGLAGYRVVVDALSDTQTVNNEYYAYTTIETAPKVLVIEGQAGFGSEFCKVLEAANLAYSCVTPNGTPESLDTLLEYRTVVTVDVHADDFKEGFLETLEAFVRDYGGGYIATGGENSFALGAYKDTPLETILPVSMDLKGEKEIPQMSMVMVIDHSGSMSDGNGRTTNLELAKSAALAALDNLRDSDKVGILSFSDSYTWNCPIVFASDSKAAEDGILSINIAGGTSIYPALAEAVEALKKDDAALRHVILLTDGQDGFRQYDDVLEEISDNQITLSTVSVGQDADEELLKTLAESGNGRYYHTDITTNLPRIFAKEVFLSARSYLVNKDFTPAISSNSAVITKTAREGLPVMHGYVASTAKDTADVMLLSDENDPVLASWQYGLGKTVAFTSDVKNLWTSEYARWSGYTAFWKAIVESTITGETAGDVSASAVMDGNTPKIIYKTKDYSPGAKVTAICTAADGSQMEIALSPTSPGTYEGEIDMSSGTGVYSINVRQSENNTVIHSLNTALAVPYSREYRFFENTGEFDAFVTSVSGKYISEPGEVFDSQLQKVYSVRPLTMFFMVMAVMLFMVDVILRRLGLYSHLMDRMMPGVKSFVLQLKSLWSKAGFIRSAGEKKQAGQGRNGGALVEEPVKTDGIDEKSIKNQEKDAKIEKKSKKVIEKTQRRGYNKTDSVLDTNTLLRKKKDRDSKL